MQSRQEMDSSNLSLAPQSEQQTQLEESTTQPGQLTEKEVARAIAIQRVVGALARGRTIEQSCQFAGISKSTWYYWRKQGYVQDVINTKFNDVTSGVKELVADSLIASTRVLAELAQGKIPQNTKIDGVLAPRDVVAAQQQLMSLWEKLGGDQESKAREQERLLEELQNAHISIQLVHIDTVNIGDESQPMPVPVGVTPVEVIEGEFENGDDDK